MKLFAFSCLASAALAKDIKQRMMENRLKFDRDVVITGDLEDDEEWDPWDLEDEELQVGSTSNRICSNIYSGSST